MVSKKTARVVATFFRDVDELCRKDFSKEFIVSERDYVSMFSNLIRHPLGIFSSGNFAHVQTFNSVTEQLIGCDGIIIFKLGEIAKIGVYESKVIKKEWDTLNSKKESRFTTQLDRQNSIVFIKSIAVWEMFFNKEKFSSPLPLPFFNDFSTCIKHEDAFNFLSTKRTTRNGKWSYKELENLIKINTTNIYEIIYEILTCNWGLRLDITDKGCEIGESRNEKIYAPIFNMNSKNSSIVSIQEFLKKVGLKSYCLIDLENINPFIGINRKKRIKNFLERTANNEVFIP